MSHKNSSGLGLSKIALSTDFNKVDKSVTQATGRPTGFLVCLRNRRIKQPSVIVCQLAEKVMARTAYVRAVLRIEYTTSVIFESKARLS